MFNKITFPFFHRQENLSGFLKEWQALNLSGTQQGEPHILSPSCARTRELTIYLKSIILD